MTPRHVLVVGTGSIGRRHIANLLALGAHVLAYSYRAAAPAGSAFAAAPAGSALAAAPLPEGAEQVTDLAAALQRVDAVVVANRTDQHIPVALQAARAGRALFVEKPLSADLHGVQQLLDEVSGRALIVEAGYMLRLHHNLQWLRAALAEGLIGEVFCARAAVGQWLPDWRPGTDHRQGYGARRATGGGVIFDLVHELDLIHWLLGPVHDVSAMTRTVPALEIETEAVAQIGLRLASGVIAQVHLDYVRPGYGRHFELVGRQGVLAWDYTAGTVSLERPGAPAQTVHRVPEGFQRNDMFRGHMAHFLARVQGQDLQAASPLSDGVAVLRMALAAHLSSRERRAVDPRSSTLAGPAEAAGVSTTGECPP